MKKSKIGTLPPHLHLRDIAVEIGVTYRTAQNYSKLIKEQYRDDYDKMVQERKRPGKGGRAVKMYLTSMAVPMFENIRDNKPVKEPEAIEIVRAEVINERSSTSNRPVPEINDVDSWEFEDKRRLVFQVCEVYQENERSIREICYDFGLRITSFMKLLVKNTVFKKMFDDANKIRKHVLIAELEFYEHQSLLDKVKPKKIKSVEIISDLVPEFHDDGRYSMKEIPKSRKERNTDYTPTPMTIALASNKRNEILQEISDDTGDVSIPDFKEMTPDERRKRLDELRSELEERRQKRINQ